MRRACIPATSEALPPSRAATALHGFVWHDLADRYVEMSKTALAGGDGEPARRESRATLLFVLERTLRLLHPIAPHVTEELWHALPHDGELLALARWPSAAEVGPDPKVEAEMEPVLEAVRLLRNLRSEEGIPAEATPRGWVRPGGTDVARTLAAQAPTIARLARLAGVTLLTPGEAPPAPAASRVAPLGECYLERPTAGPSRSAALARERERLARLLVKPRARLADPGFVRAAPPEVVEEHRRKEAELAERIGKIDRHLEEAAA